MPIYDPITNEELKLGDVLRSFERGDMVYVDELGEQYVGKNLASIPTIHLQSCINYLARPFAGSMERASDGRYRLVGYSKQGAKEPPRMILRPWRPQE